MLQYLLFSVSRLQQALQRSESSQRSCAPSRRTDLRHLLLSLWQQDECLLRLDAQHDGSAIDCQKVAHVETSHELHADIHAVYLKVHALETLLHDAGLEVGCRVEGVGLDLRLAVLHHDHAVAIIGIDDGESVGGQTVEETFLRVTIVLERSVIVQVVARQVGEDAAAEREASDALLSDTVRADLHEGIGTALVGHLPEQTVQRDGVGSRHLSRHGLTIYVVADGAAQSALVAKLAEDIVEHGGDGRLAVRAGHSDEVHALARVAEEVRRQWTYHFLRIGIDEVSDVFRYLFGQLLAHHDRCTQFNGLADEGMAVHLSATHSHESCTFANAAAVYLDARHFSVNATHHLLWLAILYELSEVHFLLLFIYVRQLM